MCAASSLKASASGDVSCVDEILKVSLKKKNHFKLFNFFMLCYPLILLLPILHKGSEATDCLYV